MAALFDLPEACRALAALAALVDVIAIERETVLIALGGGEGITATSAQRFIHRWMRWATTPEDDRTFYLRALAEGGALAVAARVSLFRRLNGGQQAPLDAWHVGILRRSYTDLMGRPPHSSFPW